MLPSEPHYDLLSGTWHLLANCGYSILLEHFKGHQDLGAITTLSCAATLNIEADGLAKDKLSCYIPGPSLCYILYAYGACYTGKT